MWNRLSFQKFGSWLKRDDDELHQQEKSLSHDDNTKKDPGRPHSSGGLLHRRGSKKVVPGLPRPPTFKRMNSEKREKLLEVPPDADQKRANSADLDRNMSNTARRALTPPPTSLPSMSAPDILSPHESESQHREERTIGGGPGSNIPAGARQVDYEIDPEPIDYMPADKFPPNEFEPPSPYYEHGSQRSASDADDILIQEELEAKWILNLSMHFRDMSDREKFFVTFAEEPNKWRRVTVSIDYRELSPESLESDLKSLHYQRDKSARIYEAIRDSLPDIQFYDTVTNLKLQTSDGRLHVHVTEDINETIPYPPVSAIDHLGYKRFKENSVCFDSHISGFVYKVAVHNRVYIKKEIPGPDAVEEFLYEINALSSVRDARSVIRFEGIIVDEANELIKGLLISYAEQGALVDIIYDDKHSEKLHWQRRERWARQIVEGLSEIHEAGFVQGDFTLSNIVIDHNDDAKIIDINRRGCPVGWEPPELAKLIESGQRISIYIGVKSDLYQLGMVLWALAEQQDEPERQDRPLTKTLDRPSDIPGYFKEIIRSCLSVRPRDRMSARSLLANFPGNNEDHCKQSVASRESISTHRSDKEYIDPALAVDHEDISQYRRHSRSKSSFEQVDMPSTEYIPSSDSYILPNNTSGRGRFPDEPRGSSRNRRSDCSPYPGHRSVMSFDDSELENELASLPASRETRWEQVYVDGDTKLVQRGGGEVGVHDYATQELKDVCITPGELESSFMGNKTSDETPLNLSGRADLQPMQPTQHHLKPEQGHEHGHEHSVTSKASFSDREHQRSKSPGGDMRSHDHPTKNTEAGTSNNSGNLEQDFPYESSAPSSLAPSRVGTGFSMFDRPGRIGRVGTGFSIAAGFHFPMHQDSGFAESERRSYESDHTRRSLDEGVRDIRGPTQGEEKTTDILQGEKEFTKSSEEERRHESRFKPEPTPFDSATALVPETATEKPDKSKPKTHKTTESFASTTNSTSAISNATPPQTKPLEERKSNATIRPLPSIPMPMPAFDFAHAQASGSEPPCTPNSTQSAHANTNAPTYTKTSTNQTPHTNTNTYHNTTSPFEPHTTPRYEHAYFARLRAYSEARAQSDDLSDYLTCEID
jgi:serine/threonine protein kinase